VHGEDAVGREQQERRSRGCLREDAQMRPRCRGGSWREQDRREKRQRQSKGRHGVTHHLVVHYPSMNVMQIYHFETGKLLRSKWQKIDSNREPWALRGGLSIQCCI
jgi:hypothetical protein